MAEMFIREIKKLGCATKGRKYDLLELIFALFRLCKSFNKSFKSRDVKDSRKDDPLVILALGAKLIEGMQLPLNGNRLFNFLAFPLRNDQEIQRMIEEAGGKRVFLIEISCVIANMQDFILSSGGHNRMVYPPQDQVKLAENFFVAMHDFIRIGRKGRDDFKF